MGGIGLFVSTVTSGVLYWNVAKEAKDQQATRAWVPAAVGTGATGFMVLLSICFSFRFILKSKFVPAFIKNHRWGAPQTKQWHEILYEVCGNGKAPDSLDLWIWNWRTENIAVPLQVLVF